MGSTVTDNFEVRNGLRQGCTMAPVLFNVYFNAMVARWHSQSGEAGVPHFVSAWQEASRRQNCKIQIVESTCD